MKKFLTCVAMAMLLVGCAKEYDDSGLRELINGLDTRITALESNVQALQSAIGEGVFVAKVQEYVDPDTGKTIGVTVTYTSGDVKYFEITPKADYDGPVLGVIKNGAGQLVWAIDGVAIMVDDEYVTVYQTPVFTIDDEGNLWVSIDGQDPVNLGPVTSGGATLEDGIFTDIKVLDDKIVLTLSDNSVVNIPFAEAFKLNIDASEVAYSDLKPITIPYTVSAKTANTVVNVIGYNPLDFNVEVNEENIVITPLKYDIAAKMMAYADSRIGLTSIVALCVEPEGVSIVDTPWSAEFDYVAAGEDGTVTAHVVSNVEFVAKPEQDWVHVVEVKGTLHTISIVLDDNPTLEEREGDVTIYKKDDQSATGIMQIITILQGPGSSETGPANLSKKESANSYLVYAPGEYKFKTVKGNSEESVGTVAKAEILWESDNTTTAPAANAIIASVSVDGEFIVFSTPETLVPGNALIAAKDASDVILWSWHIWIPATEIVNGTFNASAVPMMDRNLGALIPALADATPESQSIGLLYQWGRKDPFPGTASVSAADPIATNGTITLASEKQNFTVEESIQNPTVYVKTGGDSNKTWMVGLEEVNNTLWGAEKTIYDPCPPGYIVPTRDAENSPMWKGEGLTVDTTNKILKAGDTVFPVAGYLDQGEYVKAGTRTYIWSSYASSGDHNIAYYLIADGSSASVSQQRMSRGGNIRCVVANEGAIVPPTPTPGGGGDEPGDDTVDLSKDGSANSYIVSEAGDYKFKAVKGNSEDAVGTVATAELLWETENTATAPEANSIIAQVGVDGDYITFSTPETLKPGNALIAAKDAEGKILWSWHIWIPATEITTNTYGLGDVLMMSRSLGALVDANGTDSSQPDITSVGLIYQWGRKDPFMNAGSYFSSTGAHGAATVPADVFTTSESAEATIAYSIEHPTEYIKGADDSNTWCSETPDANWDASKTIYDPCPPGYRVPKYDEVSLLNKGKDDIVGWTANTANNWFAVGDPSTQFANAGFIEETGLGHYRSPERVIVWSSTVYSDSKRARCALYNNGSASSSTKQAQARGGIVRCVVEIPVN